MRLIIGLCPWYPPLAHKSQNIIDYKSTLVQVMAWHSRLIMIRITLSFSVVTIALLPFLTVATRNNIYDGVIKWKHFPLNCLCVGNSQITVNSPHKGQWRGALMFSLICTRTNVWVNNRDAGDLRLHWAHYDITVMRRYITVSSNCVAWYRQATNHYLSQFWPRSMSPHSVIIPERVNMNHV